MSRWTVGLVLVAALVIGAIVVAVRPTQVLDPGTPAGTVQRYVQLVMAGDHDLAAKYFAADTTCDAGDLDRAYVDREARIDLLESSIDGARAHVRVAVSTPTDDILRDTWTEERTMRLVKVSGQWLLTGIPWPLYECGVWLK